MGRSLNLRQHIINQFIDSIEKGHLPSPLPSQSIIAEMFNVSRTTVRYAIEDLCQKGILAPADHSYIIVRQPDFTDRFDDVPEEKELQQVTFEKHFYDMIHQHKLKPGDIFTELQLARDANVSAVVVREFLLRFLHYGLISNVKRGLWQMVVFSQDYAEKLFELREMLEVHSLMVFMTLPKQDVRWIKAKELLARHKELQQSMNLNYRLFSTLDHDFHQLILSATDNPFFVQSFDLISVIFHFHYQWDDKDLKQRNSVAVAEHIAVLEGIVSKNPDSALEALHRHLNTAKQSMIHSISRQW